MRRVRKVLKAVARTVVGLGVMMSGVTAWTHYGRGSEAPRIGLSLSGDWYDTSEINPAATGLARRRERPQPRTRRPAEPRPHPGRP